MAKRKPYIIRVKEFGRGPATVHHFASLYDAQRYIEDRWEGPDYMDGPAAFHTDYCTYQLSGFTLDDLGKLRWHPDVYDGRDYGWFEWDWHTDIAKADDGPIRDGTQGGSAMTGREF